MSGHLIGCVKPIKDIPSSHKLALTAFADSADDRTHIGFPGYEGVMEWADVARSTAAGIIADLVKWGYLKLHKRGRRGQRAEYVVFPNGCCDVHRAPIEEPDVDVEELATAAGVSVGQARALLAALSIEKGSEDLDPLSGNGSNVLDPIAGSDAQPVENGPNGSEQLDPNGGKGPERVHGSRSNHDAFTTSNNSSPQPPPASRQGSCSKHPDGGRNCRACGTTGRQLEAEVSKSVRKSTAEERLVRQLQDREAAAAAHAHAAAIAASGASAARAALTAARSQETQR